MELPVMGRGAGVPACGLAGRPRRVIVQAARRRQNPQAGTPAPRSLTWSPSHKIETMVFSLFLAALAGTGCVTEKQAQTQARQAYVMGQERAMQAAMHARQQESPVVILQGQVRHPEVPWQEGMKLSQAIVTAEYTGFMNPRLIRVMRSGKVAGEFKGIDLLHHQDMELDAGDVILIVP